MKARQRPDKRSATATASRPAPTARPQNNALALPLAVTADAGSRQRAALSLQATVGNRAVAASVTEISRTAATTRGLRVINAVASTAAPPPGGAEQIHHAAAPRNAAGFTSLPAPGAPDVVIGAPLQQANGQWAATVNSTSVTPDAARSLFPGQGVHAEGQLADGTPVHRRVTPAAANEIKLGEEEHLLDLEHARDLAYDRVADAVNRVAASGPALGTSPDEARRAAEQNVRSAVPAKSRWPLGTDPITHWRVLYGRLVAVTRERDDRPNRWHSIDTTVDYDARLNRSLGIPANAELRTYLAGTTQVGQHPSGPLVLARYNAQPDGPLGTPVQPNQPAAPTERTRPLEQTNGPTSEEYPPDTFSPAGDYEYTPSREYLAVRALKRRGS